MDIDLRVVLVTVPDAATGQAIGRAIVEERLAACVNRIPGLVSTYRFKGTIHEDPEELLVVKTTSGRLPALERRLAALHPYEVPEFVVLPVEHASPAYLAWARSMLG